MAGIHPLQNNLVGIIGGNGEYYVFFDVLSDLLESGRASFDVGMILSKCRGDRTVSLLHAASAFGPSRLVKGILRKAEDDGVLDKVVRHRDPKGRAALHLTSNVEVTTFIS